MPRKTYTSLTVLNSSFEARAGDSSDLTSSVAAGGGGGSCLVLRDLRMSRNCWASCMNSTCDDAWFRGGVRQEVGEHGVVSVARDGGGLPGGG
jgi:hypothetical protein